MKPLIKKIYTLGTSNIKEDYQKSAVEISNVIAAIFFLTGVIYGLISAYLEPELIDVCVLLIIGSLFILLLNYLEFVVFSRFVLNLIICLDVAIYHGYIVQQGEPLIVSIYIGQFVVAMLPWIYVDAREKWLLITTLFFSVLIFVAQPWTNNFLDKPLDSAVFNSPVFTIPTYFFSIAAFLFCMYLLHRKNIDAEIGIKKLLADMQKQNREMEVQHEDLVKTLEENKLAAEAEEKRNWIAKGLSQLGDLLRGDLEEQFYRRLVSALVHFLKINQAGIYTVEEEEEGMSKGEKYLELQACYAFDRNKYLHKRIEIGQGLVGQCYLEKEKIVLKEVPDSYINITSGLGDATPKCVVIVPLMHDEHVEGILELASFNLLVAHELEFLDRLAESLAAFIASNRINLKTKHLLEQSQQQAEELRAQEEEMRQNMEELQATQEEIHRKEKEYLDRIALLESEAANSKSNY